MNSLQLILALLATGLEQVKKLRELAVKEGATQEELAAADATLSEIIARRRADPTA